MTWLAEESKLYGHQVVHGDAHKTPAMTLSPSFCIQSSDMALSGAALCDCEAMEGTAVLICFCHSFRYQHYVNGSYLVQLSVTIDRRRGTAVFDFAGTGPEVHGNTNAPPAVTYSAIIYALRCMVHQDIPLNQVSTL